jgi:hypothetical protein
MYWKGEENLSLHLLSTDFLLEVYTNAIELNDNKDFILLLEKELNNRQSINKNVTVLVNSKIKIS